MKQLKLSALLVLLLTCFAAKSYEVKRVLVIGDSISIGYTPFIKAALSPDVDYENPDCSQGVPTYKGTVLRDSDFDCPIA